MWTPSVILFAARVFLISAMIASWVGISANARALALETSRSRCSVSLKIRPS
jgi:hypothetical protein